MASIAVSHSVGPLETYVIQTCQEVLKTERICMNEYCSVNKMVAIGNSLVMVMKLICDFVSEGILGGAGKKTTAHAGHLLYLSMRHFLQLCMNCAWCMILQISVSPTVHIGRLLKQPPLVTYKYAY